MRSVRGHNERREGAHLPGKYAAVDGGGEERGRGRGERRRDEEVG
jgi:hypothetical protein